MLFAKSDVCGSRGNRREVNDRVRNARRSFAGVLYPSNVTHKMGYCEWAKSAVVSGKQHVLAGDIQDTNFLKGTANPRIFKEVKTTPNVSEWI